MPHPILKQNLKGWLTGRLTSTSATHIGDGRGSTTCKILFFAARKKRALPPPPQTNQQPLCVRKSRFDSGSPPRGAPPNSPCTQPSAEAWARLPLLEVLWELAVHQVPQRQASLMVPEPHPAHPWPAMTPGVIFAPGRKAFSTGERHLAGRGGTRSWLAGSSFSVSDKSPRDGGL